jgi:chloride channel protein, CIC family
MQRIALWAAAAAVAGTAIFFALAADFVEALFRSRIERAPYLPLLITPVGVALAAWLVRFFPGTAGSGIPPIIAALAVTERSARSGLISLRIAFGKIALTLLGIGAGASVGREGPMVQIGASIMHALGGGHRPAYPGVERGLIVAGGAAGIAAAFNTPLTGIVFAVEMSRSLEERTSGTILTAVILAGFIARAVLGDYTYFGRSSATASLADVWIAIGVVGVAGGLAGGLFSKVVIAVSRGIRGRLGVLSQTRPVVFAAACGLVLALIGFASDGTSYGTGYYEARHIIEGTADLPWTYGLYKLMATIVSAASGIPGGLFAPSLAIGAGLGANLAPLLPYLPATVVALLGMVAFFAGVLRVPITAFVIVLEMTGSQHILMPLMATSLIATGMSRLVCPVPLFEALAADLIPSRAPLSSGAPPIS